MKLEILINDATMVTMDERRSMLEGYWWQGYYNQAVENLLDSDQAAADSSYF